jgi:hypothetical protein
VSNSQRAIAALVSRRAELLRHRRKLFAEARAIGRELEAVRKELRVLAPRRSGIGLFRHVIRRAINERPMLTTELTVLVMQHLDLDANDKTLRHTIRKRVHACLKELRRDGKVASVRLPGLPNRWRKTP